MNFPQVQQPSPIPAFEDMEQRVHPFTPYVLAAIFGIGGFFFGLDHPRYPLALFIGVGIILGLLAVPLLKHLATFLVLAALICAAGFGTLWLFEHTTELRHRYAAPATQTAPTSSAKAPSHGLFEDLRKVVQ